MTDQFNLGGGIEHIYQVAKGLKDTRFGIFGQPGPAREKFTNLKNVEIHDNGFAPSYVMEKSPDLVHFHHLRPMVSFFINPFRRWQVPVIFTAHGLHIHKYEFYDSMTAAIKYFLRFHLERRVFSKPNRIIAVSREDKRFMEEKYKLQNVTYLTNGIDFSAITAGNDQSKKDLREKLGLPAGEFLFVTVARFNFQKGYDILIKAISLVRDVLEKIPCRFVFVGDGTEFEAMKQLSKSLSVSRYIIFMGPRTDVYDILRAGDVFLLSSRWEGLPIVLLETGLLKVPVVASDTYGNREIVKETNGILFKNRDVDALGKIIIDVLDGKYNLTACAESMYREVQDNYNLEKMLSGLREIYGVFKQ